MDAFSIDYLEGRPDVIREVAGWVWREWGYGSVDDCAAELRRSRRGTVPSRFVALAGVRPAGIVNLIECNLPPRCDLGPWLAGLYVHEDHRRRGIGAALVRFCEREGVRLGCRRLYLYTERAEGFYRRLGWSPFESVVWRGEPVAVMVRDLELSPAGRAPLRRRSGRRGG